MKKLFLLFGLLSCFMSFFKAQNVNIPDANFKNYLINNPLINTNGDNEIQISEANNFSGFIYCSGLNIKSMVGLEQFPNLTYLNCEQNQLKNLDITNNIALTGLLFSGNQLTNIDLSKNTKLNLLYCGGNQLSNLDLGKNPKLFALYCESNQLTNLDISKNLLLTNLSCSDNKITSLNVSYNRALTNLSCSKNKIENFDVSNNSNLTDFLINDNQLINLNVRNGNNTILQNPNFKNNPNLNCIQVDNVSYSSINWPIKDATANYSTNCLLSVNDINKKEIAIFPNPAKENINFSEELSNIKISDLSGKVVKQISSSEKSIDVSKLAKGTYIITATSKSGELINRKFIKE